MTPPPKITSADRSLKRAGIVFLVVAAIAISLRIWLTPASAANPMPEPPWYDYARFAVNAVLTLAIVWFGFELSIGLEAKGGDSAAWSRPAVAICGYAASYVAEQSVHDVLAASGDSTSVALRMLFWWLRVVMTFVLIACCLPLVWYLMQQTRGALGDLRAEPIHEHQPEPLVAGDQWAAVDDLALRQLHKTIMGEDEIEPEPMPAPRGKRR
jgi:hypothetical protein